MSAQFGIAFTACKLLEILAAFDYLRWQVTAMPSFFLIPKLTGPRTAFALTVALAVDAIQIGLGPIGALTFLDEALDFAAMGLISWAVGFHPLLLPTFIIELVPLVDMVPTWTGCTVAVLVLRKRAEANEAASTPASEPPPMMKPAQVLKDESTSTERRPV